MQRYIGTKIVHAQPEDRQFAGGPGYRVRYEDGHESWSPAAAFEAAYRQTNGMTFGLALEALKKGMRVARKGWNGKGMWLALTPGSVIPPEAARSGACKAKVEAEGNEAITILPHIDMRAADGSIVIGWLASQTDMLAEDWGVIE